MARPKKFTDEESKSRRKDQTRKAVRRTRAKKTGMTVIAETGVTIVTEDFLTGERTVEDWERSDIERLKKVAQRAHANGVHDCAEIVRKDPRGTLKIDDSIPDVAEEWES